VKNEGEDKFEMFKEKLESDLENFYKKNPYKIAQEFEPIVLLHRAKYTPREQLDYLEKIDFKKFVEFSDSFLSTIRLEWLIVGNMNEEHA